MRVKRFVLISAAAVAATAGAGGAIAAVTKDDGKQAEQSILNDAAKRLNVSPDDLRNALSQAEDAQLDQAVKDGKLTQQQADAIKAARKQDGRVLGMGPGRPGFGHGPGGPRGFAFGFLGAGMDAAAKALGITTDQLRTQLQSGKSIADLAKANNKNVDDVKAAIKDAVTKQLDADVKAGKLTDAQRQQIATELDQHLDDLVNATPPRFARPGMPGMPGGPGFGPGGPRGMGFGFFGAGIDAAAKALGITTDQLRTQLQSGKSVADVAKANNKSLDDVKAAIKDAVTKQLDADVKAGRLTDAQRQQIESELDQHLDKLLNGRPGTMKPGAGAARLRGHGFWQ